MCEVECIKKKMSWNQNNALKLKNEKLFLEEKRHNLEVDVSNIRRQIHSLRNSLNDCKRKVQAKEEIIFKITCDLDDIYFEMSLAV